MNFEFHPEALEEYQEASRYYAERDPQLACRYCEATKRPRLEDEVFQ